MFRQVDCIQQEFNDVGVISSHLEVIYLKPLADLVRPLKLDEVVGQQHLIAEGSMLKKLLDVDHIPNMIFYGPSGTGKTTIANIIARASKKKIFKLNATIANTSDIKDVINQIPTLEASNGILLYLDEIQNFNKKQQQTVLKYIESGEITYGFNLASRLKLIQL